MKKAISKKGLKIREMSVMNQLVRVTIRSSMPIITSALYCFVRCSQSYVLHQNNIVGVLA